MARPKAKAPSRRYHLSGQSVVTIDGKDYDLGIHDSPESMARYAVLISVYQANGLGFPMDFDPAQLDGQVSVLLSQQASCPQQSSEPLTVRHITACYR